MGGVMDQLNNLIIPVLYPLFLMWLIYEIFKSIKTKKFRDNVLIALLGCVLLYLVRNPNEAAALGGILFKATKAAASFICNLLVKLLEGLDNVKATNPKS